MYNDLIKHFEGFGFSRDNAIKEIETIIKYHTTGVDSVSREYAIEMMHEEIFED